MHSCDMVIVWLNGLSNSKDIGGEIKDRQQHRQPKLKVMTFPLGKMMTMFNITF